MRRVILEVCDRIPDGLSVFLELAEGAVAALTENRPHFSADVIVVHMNGRSHATDRAESVLLPNHPIDIVGADSVLLLQVVVPTPTVESLLRLATPRVVAGLAVGG